MVILAPPLRQPVLPASGTAGLHDAEHDERLFESEGRQLRLLHHIEWLRFGVLYAIILLFFFCPSVDFQQSVEGVNRCCNLYCVLSAGSLSCYFTPEEIDAKVQPTLNVQINNVREGNIKQIYKQRRYRKNVASHFSVLT